MSETSLKAIVGQNNTKRFVSREVNAVEETEYRAFGFGRVGPRPEIMLEFQKADGYRLAVSYIDIKEIETLDPSKGFIVLTQSRKFVIDGANLDRCYIYLRQNRIAELVEISRPAAMNCDVNEAIVTNLRIQTRSTERF